MITRDGWDEGDGGQRRLHSDEVSLEHISSSDLECGGCHDSCHFLLQIGEDLITSGRLFGVISLVILHGLIVRIAYYVFAHLGRGSGSEDGDGLVHSVLLGGLVGGEESLHLALHCSNHAVSDVLVGGHLEGYKGVKF